MNGFSIESGQLVITNGSRTVSSTEGTLVNLLPTQVTFTAETLAFPHPPMDYCYAWGFVQDFIGSAGGSDNYDQSNTGQVFFTATPEEYESTTVLMAAPDGADIFFGMVKFTQTTAPTHTWYSRDLAPLLALDVWIPWNGSGLIEAALGITRLVHLAIEDGDLVLVAQQSVGPPMGGGNRYWGDTNQSPYLQDAEGGEFVPGSAEGFAVWTSTSSPYRKSSGRGVSTSSLTGPSDYTTHRSGGSDPVDTTNPTDYTSTYSVDIVGQFGRRS